MSALTLAYNRVHALLGPAMGSGDYEAGYRDGVNLALEQMRALSVEITKRPKDEAYSRRLHAVAAILDHPSVYMSGPSRQAVRTAQRIMEVLEQ